MNAREFDDALDRYGADLARWPDAARRAAEGLIARDPAAAERHRQAQDVARLLAEMIQPEPVDAAFVGRMVGGPRQRPAGRMFHPSGRLVAWTSAAMIVAMVVGFGAGLLVPGDPSVNAMAGLLFGGGGIDAGGLL